jgi:hypothetical protein
MRFSFSYEKRQYEVLSLPEELSRWMLIGEIKKNFDVSTLSIECGNRAGDEHVEVKTSGQIIFFISYDL